jgi:single-strand DNA-binding protein
MASFNRVILLGNLTRDPQLKYLPSQTPVVEFGMALNRKYKTQSGEDREEATFVECSAFARTAEIINQYCHKGSMLFVEGRLKYDQWEDKQGGGKRSKLTVHVDNVQLMPRTGGGGGGGGAPAHQEGGEYDQSADRPQPQRPPQSRPQNAPPPQQPFGEEQQFKEDDIPF